MKIDNSTLSSMQSDIEVIIKHFNIEVSMLTVYNINSLYYMAYCSRKYDSTNKNVLKDSAGNRLLSQNLNYSLYPCNTNDTTIFTAFNRILKNLNK